MTATTAALPVATPETRAFHRDTLVFDCLTLYYGLDEPYTSRILEGGVNVANVTFGLEEDWDTHLRKIDAGLEKIAKSKNMVLATSAAEIEAAKRAGKLAIIMGTQGAAPIGNQLSRIRVLYRLGLRIIGLAYTPGNLLGDGCGEKRDGGLTYLGEEFVAAVNELPLLLDLSHTGHQSRAEAIKLARAPVFTHANAYALNANDRNAKDDAIKAAVAKGGMIGVVFLPRPVKPSNPTVHDVLDHVDYLVKLVGADRVGFGGDYVEGYAESKVILPDSRRWRTLRPDIFGSVDDFVNQAYPAGISSVRDLANLTQGLLDRGYTKDQAAGIMGGNWLRTFRQFCG